MLHIYKYILSEYICNRDKVTLLQGKRIQDFDLPLTHLGIDIHWSDDYALRYACENGNLPVIKYLHSKGADLTAMDNYCLSSACENGHLDIVKFFRESKVDIFSTNNYALRHSCYYGKLPIIKYLVEFGADIHDINDDAVSQACTSGQLDVVEYLVDIGADIEKSECIYIARYFHHYVIVEFLKSIMSQRKLKLN
jgi:ankyrin repeat protein